MLADASQTNILMVDDHPIVRESMAQFLNVQRDFRVCCQASNIREALEAMHSCHPEAVIVDISLDGDSGLDLIRTLRQRYPGLPILALSMHDESVYAEHALGAGANGYLMKHEATRNILLALRQMLGGKNDLSGTVQNGMARRLVGSRKPSASLPAALSEREFEILNLIGLGLGTREIAERLGRSIKTIETHRASLKEKLQLRSGRDLMRFAVHSHDAGQGNSDQTESPR